MVSFPLEENIYIMFSGCLYNRIVAAVMCVCVLGEVWHNPFWIVKFRISIPRINHKVEKKTMLKIIGGEL